MSIEEVADQLYALAPEEFTAARDEATKAADGDDRKAVKALRKPTVAAYVVNMLARHERDDVHALVNLGDDLRKAMAGKGDIRDLGEQRRELVRALVQAAPYVSGRDLTAAVEEEVAATLEAATADPDLGAAVLSGRLVKPLRYAGFGTLPDLGDAVATPLPASTPTTSKRAAAKKPTPANKPASSKKAPAAETMKKPADASNADLTKLRTQVLDLAGAADDAQRRYEQATRAVAEARKLLEQAEKERAEAHKEASAAHKEAEKARRELGKLERR
ncbi:MAG TPA: hypothetical protein VFH66_00630 [Mycobacteriales bacterium]|nr:hypothetical protein [Mycobacteriales bacterium]